MNMRNEVAGRPLKCWIEGVNDISNYGWRWFGLCRVRWVDGTQSLLFYWFRKTFILFG